MSDNYIQPHVATQPARGRRLDEIDRANEERIRAGLAAGNEWAWCIVSVSATYRDVGAEDTLCGCSYASREEWDECIGGDMRRNAAELLHDALMALRAESLREGRR